MHVEFLAVARGSQSVCVNIKSGCQWLFINVSLEVENIALKRKARHNVKFILDKLWVTMPSVSLSLPECRFAEILRDKVKEAANQNTISSCICVCVCACVFSHTCYTLTILLTTWGHFRTPVYHRSGIIVIVLGMGPADLNRHPSGQKFDCLYSFS